MIPPPADPARPWWPLLALTAVVAGQAGMALHLFGPDPLAAVADPRPVVSGRHPLHLYHGWLGAAAFADRYTTTTYDPDFQAGYPKTPVFDGGCRPAEAWLFALGHSRFDPAAYKWGLVLLCSLVPVAFAVAAAATGSSPAGILLAAVGGCLVWWTPPVRTLFDAGYIDLLTAGLMGVVFVGGLARYAAHPGPAAWLALALPAAVGWYAQPLAWAGLLPCVAVFYLAVAPRHGPAWHLGLAGVAVAGLAPNLWWLWDWGRYWWLRQPTADDLAPLPPPDVLLGEPGDYLSLLGTGPVGWGLLAVGGLGLLGYLRTGRRAAAGAVLLAALAAVFAGRLGAVWPPVRMTAADKAAPFALAVLVLPAADLLGRWWWAAGAGRVIVGLAAGLPLALGFAPGLADPVGELFHLARHPLPLGLTRDQQALVDGLLKLTTPDARILIEEADPTRPGWNWTALLPVLTGRAYLGGLDPEASIDHAFCGLKAGHLNGRPFTDWTPDQRAAFCKRYNVGWVLCRTAAATDWWGRDPLAREVGRFRDGGELVLFALDRPRSFVLTGTGAVERADRRGIVLTDVAPDAAGEVVVSFHHSPGLRAVPTAAQVGADKDPFDPVPLVKLRLPGPVSRVTLTWDGP